MSVMGEYDFIYVVIGIASVVGVIFGIYYQGRSRKDNVTDKKDKVEETRAKLQREVETTARDKLREESKTRTELESSAKLLAADVKASMKEHIAQLVFTLKQDIELSRVMAYDKMETIDVRVAQVKIDLMDHIIQEKDERIRMQKAIEMLQTMNYGADAKSIPPYMLGQEESEEHKDEPDKGLFEVQSQENKEKQTADNEERIEKERIQ
jgi:hypothetical protein